MPLYEMRFCSTDFHVGMIRLADSYRICMSLQENLPYAAVCLATLPAPSDINLFLITYNHQSTIPTSYQYCIKVVLFIIYRAFQRLLKVLTLVLHLKNDNCCGRYFRVITVVVTIIAT